MAANETEQTQLRNKQTLSLHKKDEDIRYCVECGAGSHRPDWKKVPVEQVHCDGCELPKAVAAKPAATTVAKPPQASAPTAPRGPVAPGVPGTIKKL